MNFFRKYISLFLLCLPGVLSAVPDSLLYVLQKDSHNLSINFSGINLSFIFHDNNKDKWLYNPRDNYRFALRNYKDGAWSNVPSDFDKQEADSLFRGLGWFRLHYRVSKEYVGKTFMLRMSHFGASEMYNDNIFLGSFGLVSADPAVQIERDPRSVFTPLKIEDTLEHVLAIRYSNANYKKYYDKFAAERVGFSIRFFEAPDLPEILNISDYQNFFFIGISLFLLALALVHLMIFIFEPSRKFNLYHSFFVGTLSLLFLLPLINKMVEDPLFNFRMYFYGDALIPTFFISVLALLYNLFEKKLNRFFYISLGVFVVAMFMRFVVDDYYGGFYAALFFMMYFGSMVISIKAIRRNFRGAKIVGVGVLGVTVFLILAILSAIFFKNAALFFFLLFAILCILSLPLSMSVYLAYDFSRANATLKQQLVQIEDLSARALKEEQEKKEILENQNRVLEEQVKERTAEISQQKEIIEEKNKDITDSINYAKRIQDAILASREIKYRLFPNAFVLFKPKDIVSGDFYWFAGKGDRRLIAACDCTGHGVPGALMSMIGNNLLNQLVNEKGLVSPDEILNQLHNEVRRTLKQAENAETKDGMDAALLSFINETEFEYAGAQRPLWMIRNGELIETKATKMSVGGQKHDDSMMFTKHHFKAQKNDLVYIFSDGFADQFNREDKKLMTRKFKEILISIRDMDMPAQEKYLDEFIDKWKGDLEQTDDILVIGIRI